MPPRRTNQWSRTSRRTSSQPRKSVVYKKADDALKGNVAGKLVQDALRKEMQLRDEARRTGTDRESLRARARRAEMAIEAQQRQEREVAREGRRVNRDIRKMSGETRSQQRSAEREYRTRRTEMERRETVRRASESDRRLALRGIEQASERVRREVMRRTSTNVVGEAARKTSTAGRLAGAARGAMGMGMTGAWDFALRNLEEEHRRGQEAKARRPKKDIQFVRKGGPRKYHG